MPVAVLLSRCILAAVLAAAAIAKWRDPAGARTGATDLGVPAGLAAATARVLPVLEAATAVALLLPWTARAASAAAIALLVVLTAALGRVIAAGGRPRCHCFGARSARPAGPDAIVRNLALLALGAVALLG